MVLKWVWHYETDLKRQIMEMKYTDSPKKKTIRAQLSIKKVMLIVFWDVKGPITIDFLEKEQL